MAQTKPAARPWSQAAPAPLVLVSGPEQLLAARAVDAICAKVRKARGSAAVTRVSAPTAGRGALRSAASPSLFDEPGVVVVEELEALGEAFQDDALDYAAAPDPDVCVVFLHAGTARGKKVLDALRAAGAAEYTAPAVKKAGDFVDFAAQELASAGARAGEPAVRALVDAVGNDLPEIAAACLQLAQDVGASIAVEDVERYYGTRVNATGFAVADAAAVGKSAEALALVRHALASGTDPVPLVAALGAKLRIMAKVGASRGRQLDPVRDLGLAPWQVDRARRDLRGWDADRVAAAIEAVAEADAQVKGAGRHPRYAVERAVREVARLAAE